jgi:hypothetical protein
MHMLTRIYWHKGVFWREWRQNRGVLLLFAVMMSVPNVLPVLLFILYKNSINENDIADVLTTLKNPHTYFVYTSLWAAGIGAYSYASEWLSQNLQLVLAGPVGRKHVIFTKFWNGWLYLQLVVPLNFIWLSLFGHGSYSWFELSYDWWSYASGLSAVYVIACMGSVLSGTFRGAIVLALFLLYGLDWSLQLLAGALDIVFRNATLHDSLVQLGQWLNVTLYTAAADQFANPYIKIGLWILFFGIGYLVFMAFERAPLERMGRFFLFRWAQSAAFYYAILALFVVNGTIWTGIVLSVFGSRFGNPTDPVPVLERLFIFLVSGTAIVFLFWWGANKIVNRSDRSVRSPMK